MIFGFEALPETPETVYDVAVIGSGPAGMSVAMRLGERGKRAIVLEGGEESYTDASQDIYRGTVVGDPYYDLDVTRLRHLGGSSNHWGGYCRPMEAHIFERRLGSEVLEWPIGAKDLEPYLADTRRILETEAPDPDFVYDAAHGVRTINWEFSPPTRFAWDFRDRFEGDGPLDLCLRANATGLILEDDRVTGVAVQDYDGTRRVVRAEAVVLAAGGLENSRFLLAADRAAEGALVDPRCPLGEYWMEHPHFWVGNAVLDRDFENNAVYALTPEKQAELGILSCGIAVGRIREAERGWAKRTAASIACTAPELGQWVYSKLDRRLFCGASLRAHWEQAPDKANRIVLSERETDRFGMPRMELHWRKGPLERETMEKTLLQFGAALAARDAGRVRLSKWVRREREYPEDDELAGHHHMGGTRMASRPELGVVDANCRVYGRRNLFVAGSSVFATCGQVNPTMTIVQLALRLGDHLAA